MKRIKRIDPDDEKAMMGVGTLVIFISIVLVATVAASVFISTVKTLQQKAEETSQQSLETVSTLFNVRSSYGYRIGGSSKIDYIIINLGLGPGCPPQNLSYTLIRIDDGETDAGLEYHAGESDASHYNATVLLDPEDKFNSTNPVMHPGTTLKLNISAEDIGLDLSTQTKCMIEITPKHGTPTIESFTTPSVYTKKIVHFG